MSVLSFAQVTDIVIEDTGFYHCFYDGVTNFVRDDEKVDTTYVYVHGMNIVILMIHNL